MTLVCARVCVCTLVCTCVCVCVCVCAHIGVCVRMHVYKRDRARMFVCFVFLRKTCKVCVWRCFTVHIAARLPLHQPLHAAPLHHA